MGRVKAWDPRTGQELSDLSGPEIVYPVLPSGFSRQKLNLGSFVLSHQGKLAASFDNNNPLWDKPLETRRFQGALLLLWDTATGEVVHSLPGGFTGRAAFSPDGTLVAVPAWKGFVEVIVQIVDVETGKVLTRPQIPSPAPLDILALAFSPDGTRLACANFLPEGPGAVSVWDLASGQRVWESQLDNGLRTIAYSPNGSLLAAAGTDGIIHIWDAADGQHGYTLLGHEGVIHKLAFHPNSRYLASAGTDGTARIWDLRTKKAIHTLRHSRGVTDIAFSPDAKWLATSLESGDGGVVVWNLQPAKETK
jgi:WD40 repeat protein